MRDVTLYLCVLDKSRVTGDGICLDAKWKCQILYTSSLINLNFQIYFNLSKTMCKLIFIYELSYVDGMSSFFFKSTRIHA